MRETDKLANGFFDFYEKLFADLKDERIKYLEVGILNGGSLEWARNFFTNWDTWIYGIDKEPPPRPAVPGTTTWQVDQADSESLRMVGEKDGPFDIIIDDASHVRDLTENTFECLYPFLKPDGFYIIEDWGADFLFPGREFKGMEAGVIKLVWNYGGSMLKLKSGANVAIIGQVAV